jgi:general L-amino acid transport system permease protein
MTAAVGASRTSAWVRRSLFRTPLDAVLTVVFGSVGLYVLYRVTRFVLVTARWEIVDRNLTLLLVGRYPANEMSRVAVSLVVLGAWSGVIAGVVHARQVRAGTSRVRQLTPLGRLLDLLGRFALIVIAAVLLLALSSTAGPWLTVAAMVAAAVVARAVAAAVAGRVRVPALVAVPIVLTWWLASAVGWDEWGGFMLNVFVAATAIILCFPLGVLLALGRRSKLPLLRLLATVYIELFRGSPLFVLLLMANVALEFFVPRDLAPGVTVRAIVVFTLFTAAYLAEIVRGGLQSIPNGQVEAAKALGLSPTRTTALIVLPQALRNVIPAQIGQFISLFKDTTLAGAAMGVLELLQVGESITKQPDFRGQGLIIETLAFVGFLFWVVSFTMSRESQRLERRLGVGTR